MLTKTQKYKVVEDIADKFNRQKISVFTDFSGVSVARFQALRRALKKSEAEYKVAKKTLLDRALAKWGVGFATKELQGEIGVAFGYGDETAPAKALVKFARENDTFKILGAILGSRILNEKEVRTIARLPSREVLLAQLAGALSSPIRGLMAVLNGNIRNLVAVINKIEQNKS